MKANSIRIMPQAESFLVSLKNRPSPKQTSQTPATKFNMTGVGRYAGINLK